jgi:hypothetical protein
MNVSRISSSGTVYFELTDLHCHKRDFRFGSWPREKSDVQSARRNSVSIPSIDRRADIRDGFVDLAITLFLHAQADFQLLLQREVLEIEGLAWPDADTCKLGADFLLVLLRGRKL